VGFGVIEIEWWERENSGTRERRDNGVKCYLFC
jgi:hypothetical protein